MKCIEQNTVFLHPFSCHLDTMTSIAEVRLAFKHTFGKVIPAHISFGEAGRMVARSIGIQATRKLGARLLAKRK